MSILTGSLSLNRESFILGPDVVLTNESKYASAYGNTIAFAEAYEDLAGIIEAAASYDIQELAIVHESRQTGVTVESLVPLYEASITDRVKEFFAKIKDMIKKLWAKIKAFFANAAMAISALFMKGKSFVSKYKSKLEKVKSKKVKIEGFKFTNLEADTAYKVSKASFDNLTSTFKKVSDKLNDVSKKENKIEYEGKMEDDVNALFDDLKEKKEDFLDKVRGELIGKKDIQSDMFQEELYKHFRDNNLHATEMSITVSDAITVLESDYTNTVKKIENAFDTDFKEQTKTIEGFEKSVKAMEFEEDAPYSKIAPKYMEAASLYNSESTGIKSIVSSFFTAWKFAISAAEVQSKKVCVMAVSGKTEDRYDK